MNAYAQYSRYHNSRYGKCICPYCMEEIPRKAVHFRSPSGFTADEVKQELGRRDKIEEITPDINGRIDKMLLYEEQKDLLYQDFWKNFQVRRRARHCGNLVITQENCLELEAEFLYREGESLPYAVKDYWGKKSTYRVCPLCHNDLPSDYGTCPVSFVAITGNDQKLVQNFLNRLCMIISSISVPEGISAIVIDDGESDYEENAAGQCLFYSPVIYQIIWKGAVCGMLVLHALPVAGGIRISHDEYFVKCLKHSDRTVVLWDAEIIKRKEDHEAKSAEMISLIDNIGRIYLEHIRFDTDRLGHYALMMVIPITSDWKAYPWLPQNNNKSQKIWEKLKRIGKPSKFQMELVKQLEEWDVDISRKKIQSMSLQFWLEVCGNLEGSDQDTDQKLEDMFFLMMKGNISRWILLKRWIAKWS